jgi:hypothetical protein
VPTKFETAAELRAYAQTLRGSDGHCSVPAAVYRDLVVEVAVYAAGLPDLDPEDERFIRDCCAGIDGLGEDFDRQVVVPAGMLYRLSQLEVKP